MKEIMGMLFPDDKVPDFGSIRLTGVKGNTRKYVLKSEDIGRLDLITNAASGSSALCVDTGDVYVTLDNEWYKQSAVIGRAGQRDVATNNEVDEMLNSVLG